MQDREIVELFWRRDERAVQLAAEQYGGYCHAIAFSILGNRQDAEECMNDALLQAWNSMPPHRPAILSTFLGKCTRFAAWKRWRARQTQKRGCGETAVAYDELSDMIASADDVERHMEEEELTKLLDSFLASLPRQTRQMFVCRYWYFDSIASISHRFHCSESKVKSTLYRTRIKLRKNLEEEGIYLES